METVVLARDCEAVSIPRGQRQTLGQGTALRIVEKRPGSYIVSSQTRAMYRIDAKDADALGLEGSPADAQPLAEKLSEQLVWDTLKTVRDPELPVNIVDLGLIYSCAIEPKAPGKHTIQIRMAMTSPGCGMSDVLKSEVETKLSRLPEVEQAHVEVVFDPPWDPDRMSEKARLQIGMDLEGKRGLIQIAASPGTRETTDSRSNHS